jgi:fructose-specific phosphotransferase system IIC component
MSKLSKVVTTEQARLIVIVLLIPVVAILLTGLCFFIMDQLFTEIPDGVRSTVAVFCSFAACLAALCAALPGLAEDTEE